MSGTLRGTCVIVVAALCVAGVAAGAAGADAKKSSKPKPAAVVTKTPDELKWVASPASPDVTVAVVMGDPAKGAHLAYHKFKAGFDAGLHSHSSDTRFVVVSGTMLISPEGGPEKKLPPGSFCFQPHGVKHVTKCDAASDCVIFASVSGKFDFLPAEAKK